MRSDPTVIKLFYITRARLTPAEIKHVGKRIRQAMRRFEAPVEITYIKKEHNGIGCEQATSLNLPPAANDL